MTDRRATREAGEQGAVIDVAQNADVRPAAAEQIERLGVGGITSHDGDVMKGTRCRVAEKLVRDDAYTNLGSLAQPPLLAVDSRVGTSPDLYRTHTGMHESSRARNACNQGSGHVCVPLCGLTTAPRPMRRPAARECCHDCGDVSVCMSIGSE